jgi:hypothetical protein
MALNEKDFSGFGTDSTGTQHAINHVAELADWESGIYQIEKNDDVLGGAYGLVNLPIRQLANRTAYLKVLVDGLKSSMPGTEEYNALLTKIKSLDLTKDEARINHLERLMANTMLALETQNMAPEGYDGMFAETFLGNADDIDQAIATVTSVVSGDDSIDVVDSSGLIIGAHYQLTDGEKIEEVQIKSLNVSGSTKRIILEGNVKNQYTDGRAKLYRSSVAIYNGRAYGGGNVRTDGWDSNTTFSGSSTSTGVDTTLAYDNAAAFEVDGADLDNGKFVLGTAVVGVALVTSGGGSGTWARVDEEGDSL